MLNKKTVDDINVKGKRVLVRCDFNVPLIDGKITDENRLVAALPTIKKLIADGGKVILCSHLGKPKGEPKPELSLAPVAVRLSELLGQEVKFAADPEVVGPNAKAAVEAMKDGDVILLENTRYRAEETKNGEEFSKELASLCDVFVNDAFGTAHRAHCSNVGVTKYVDTAVVGYLMEKEIAFLGNAVNNPERPFVAILGGSKVSSKISVIDNLIDKVDVLIIGGGMAYTFAKAAGGTVGDSLLEMDYLDYANKMKEKAAAKGVKLLLPVDNVVADAFSNDANTLHRDGVNGSKRLVTEINGKPTAQIMFFNGLSRTKESGELTSLPNPYQAENLAFSFQMEYEAEQYYPGFSRCIYLKGYRYNLHLRPRSVLLEVGAQTNTVEEVKNAMGPFSDILHKVLSGKSPASGG